MAPTVAAPDPLNVKLAGTVLGATLPKISKEAPVADPLLRFVQPEAVAPAALFVLMAAIKYIHRLTHAGVFTGTFDVKLSAPEDATNSNLSLSDKTPNGSPGKITAHTPQPPLQFQSMKPRKA